MNIDREQILHLMNEYCFRIDAGNLRGMADLFEHGIWHVMGDPTGGVKGAQALAKVLENVTLYDGLPQTKHVMTNVDIKISETEDKAEAQSYITLYQAVAPDFPLQAIFIGKYDDKFEKVDGAWRFSLREISPDLIGDLRFHRADMAE